MVSSSPFPDDSSSQTTRARSIMTLDGYVSRGKAPSSSVPRDHTMLQDFAAYLELRLKSQNLSILRRIFADFLNEQESTLVPMMRQGCTIITIFPVERTSARRRRQAEFLLSKPKFHLDSRGCVFLYLQYRAATRNMALLKHLFLEFVSQRETSLLAFVERGCQVISVIPFELPQITPPALSLSPRSEQCESPRAVETAMGQEQDTLEVAVLEKTKKKKVAVKKTRQRQPSTAGADVAKQQAAAAPNGPEIVIRSRRKRICVASTAGSACSEANEGTNVPSTSNSTTVLTLNGGREMKPDAVSSHQQPIAVEEQDEGNVLTEVLTTKTLPTAVPNETSSAEAPENSPGCRNKRAGVASSNGSANSEANEPVNVPRVSSPTTVSILQSGKQLTPGAVPPITVVEQEEGNATIEASTCESLPAEASPNKASSTEALENFARRQSKHAGVTSDNEADSNNVKQDKNTPAPTVVSILNCSKTWKVNATLSPQDPVTVAVEQAKAMPNEVLPASSGDLAIETSTTEADTSELETNTKGRLKCVGVAQSNEVNQESKASPVSNSSAELTPMRGKEPKASAVPPQQPPAAVVSEQGETLDAPETDAPETEAPDTDAPDTEAPETKAPETEAPETETPTEVLTCSKRKRRRDRNTENGEERTRKRGKPFMTEEMCRSQLDLTRKMGVFEAQTPWKVVYGNLPAPFDAERYPELARKFSRFWRKHSRAVWERKFWAPMSRKLCLPAFNKRSNRQLTAKNAFESLIVSVYEEFGAAFFVKFDTQKQRHPGWWYRGPVVALFALQQIKGEDVMWAYVNNEILQRFPDCSLSANSGHKRESESMWMVNHRLTAGILREIAALKAEKQAHEQEDASQVTTVECEHKLENAIEVVEALELM